ncbi:MAG: PQQ-like beta-propeller repeat protein, partial [Planctomycetaceae bacterium]|nr:PQQ-like beta-propeller repeat protein [Planctomycetaceae bacterium]
MKPNHPRCHAINWILVGLFCGLICWSNTGFAQQNKTSGWPQFLGPNRNGISTETGLLDTWPDSGPPEVWRTRIGGGMSGVAISEGRLYTLVQKTGQQLAIALDAKTGKSIWETPVSDAYRNSMGDGPRATPTVSGDRLFVFTGEGKLAALKTQDGKILWSHDVVKGQGSDRPAEYGMACSPLVVEDLVIVTAGAAKATVVAYDTMTGKLKWTAGRDQPAGYSSPALLTVGGKMQVVVFYGTAAAGLDPQTGKALWRYAYET